MPFNGSAHTNIHTALPFTQEDYFDLVDSTGRVLREDKRGAISANSLKLLDHLGIDPNKWLEHVTHFGKHYGRCAGSPENIEDFPFAFAVYGEKVWGFRGKPIRNALRK